MSEEIQVDSKPKRKYTKRTPSEPKSSARDLLKEIVSELKASQEEPPPTPKKKKVLSEKQKESLAKGREQRLAKLKSLSTKNKTYSIINMI
jgi:hypothetical protein